MNPRQALLLTSAAFLHFSCAPTTLPQEEGEHRQAVAFLKEADKKTLSAEQRAVLYLNSAAEASRLLSSKTSDEDARRIYNQAATDLTILLRTADQGRLWNRPLTLSSGSGTYQIRYASASRGGVWDPNSFTDFKPASEVPLKSLHRRNTRSGVGGTLVGIRKTQPPEPFSPLVGITAPVSSILDFSGNKVVLTLVDPTEKTVARVADAERSVEADFSAPLAYYPNKSETWEGLMGAIRVSAYMKTTGLYMLQPYDPDKIPLIFVHGLISTARMWRNVINEIEADPTLRGKYQCWVFAYPTGNPPAYSALRFREELAKVHELYPNSKNYVLVGHSMGGLISRMQITDFTRESWDVVGKDKAHRLFHGLKKGSLVERAAIFQANPKIDRVVFICTPHRGSEMAIGSIGELGMRLIALPADLTSAVAGSVGTSIGVLTGDSKHLPNSVSGLSPRNPALKVLDTTPIKAETHSIIGDRGKGDTPESSDGVVKYWSSRLKHARSEKIVPGPHGACELPETLDELRRILHLHLKAR